VQFSYGYGYDCSIELLGLGSGSRAAQYFFNIFNLRLGCQLFQLHAENGA
jgi:hypothetical protein